MAQRERHQDLPESTAVVVAAVVVVESEERSRD